jgi:hypothetical protein
VEDDHLIIPRAFPVVSCPGFMVVTPSFTHLSITFSNQRFSNCSPTVDVGSVNLTSDSSCRNRVFKMNIQFCRHLCCSSSVIFETILNVRRSLSVIVDISRKLGVPDELLQLNEWSSHFVKKNEIFWCHL